SPLAGGVLTGKYRSGVEPPADSRAAYLGGLRESGRPGHVPVASERNGAVGARLAACAGARGLTPAHGPLAWWLRLPERARATTGASTVAQLEENAPAFDLTLTPGEVAEIEALLAGEAG